MSARDLLEAAPQVKREQVWPEPEPLDFGFTPEIPPLDAAKLLPHPLGAWVEDTAERMNAPVEFVATAALVATAGVVGNRILIAPDPEAKPEWLEAPNLWGLLIGEPGTKKSPIMEAAFKPLHRLEAELHRENQRARDKWELDHRNRKKGDPATEDDLHPPTEEALVTHDVTVEKLADLIEQNPHGLVGYQDELLGLIATWERPEKASDRQFYLKLWNGLSPHTVRRIKRGSHWLPVCTLSLIGGTQPGPFSKYILEASNGWNNDGLLQRFQLLVQGELPGYRRVVRPPNTLSSDYAEKLHSLWTFTNNNKQDLGFPSVEIYPGATRPLFTFDPEAQALYLQWLEQTARESRQSTTPTLKRSLLEKQAGLVPKLALLLHLVENPVPTSRIGKLATVRAMALANLYRAHTLSAWWAAIQPEVRGAELLAKRILERTQTKAAFNYQRFTFRDIERSNWKGLSGRRAIEGSVGELEAKGWLIREGHAWIPNPRIWEMSHA